MSQLERPLVPGSPVARALFDAWQHRVAYAGGWEVALEVAARLSIAAWDTRWITTVVPDAAAAERLKATVAGLSRFRVHTFEQYPSDGGRPRIDVDRDVDFNLRILHADSWSGWEFGGGPDHRLSALLVAPDVTGPVLGSSDPAMQIIAKSGVVSRDSRHRLIDRLAADHIIVAGPCTTGTEDAVATMLSGSPLRGRIPPIPTEVLIAGVPG